MTVVVACTCDKADQSAAYRWRCIIALLSSEKEEEEIHVEIIREFYMRENWIPCNEDMYRRKVKLMYNNPKIVNIYNKREDVKVLEVWL
jgi:hypothetical protein